MDQLLNDMLKTNDKWDVEETKSIFQKGINGQKQALNYLLKSELLDIFILLCQTVLKDILEFDNAPSITGEHGTINVTLASKEDVKESIEPSDKEVGVRNVKDVTNRIQKYNH